MEEEQYPTNRHTQEGSQKNKNPQLTVVMPYHLLLVPPTVLTRRYRQRKLLDVVIWVSLGKAEKGKPETW